MHKQDPRSAILATVLVGAGLALGIATLVARSGVFSAFLSGFSLSMLLASVILLSAVGCVSAIEIGLSRLLGWRPGPVGIESAILGVPMFGSLSFLVGTVSTHPAPMGAVLLVTASAGAWFLLRRRPPLPALPSLGVSGLLPLAVLCLALGLELVVTQLPPTSLDELAYHLRVPKAWVLEGRVVELPLNSHSYFPMGVESAYLPLIALAGSTGAQAARLLHWLTACLVATVMARWLARRIPVEGALSACLVVVSTPCLFISTGIALVEWYLLGGCLLALVRLDDWTRGKAAPSARTTLVWSSGMATKYTVGGLGLWLLRRHPEERRRWLLCGAVGLCLGSVFLIKNLLLTGNPFAPFGGVGSPPVTSFINGETVQARLLGYLLSPSMVDESLGVALHVAALCTLWAATSRTLGWLRPVSLLMLLPLAVLAFTGVVGRVLLPFLLIPGLVGLVGVHQAIRDRKVQRGLVTAVLLAVCGGQLVAAGSLIDSYRPYSFFRSGEVGFVSDRRRSYALLRWLDGRLPHGSKTLVLGLQELYPSNRVVRGGGNSDGARVARYLEAGGSPELVRRWRGDGFTHVAVYGPRVHIGAPPQAGVASERFLVLDSQQAEVLQQALRLHTRLVTARKGLFLHALHE
jgi:hypothetical protein